MDTKERIKRYGAPCRLSSHLFDQVVRIAQDEKRTLRAQLDVLVEEAITARDVARLETRGGAA